MYNSYLVIDTISRLVVTVVVVSVCFSVFMPFNAFVVVGDVGYSCFKVFAVRVDQL